MNGQIRPYKDADYENLKQLYEHSEWYGGQFDKARDGRQRLADKIAQDPESIWLYEKDGRLLASVSLIEDGRVAWLFRFAVKDNDQLVAEALYRKAAAIFKQRGHSQVLVYSPAGNQKLNERWQKLGMNKGHDFTAFWKDL
ncbi:MAG TPA: hypothetical protein VFP35_04270 [Candidatus Saccharimonadales bacterium]|nr:hypothetical protein [Candidatus Saccharimonadales bacterium]